MAKQKFGKMDATDFVVPKASNIALTDSILQDSSREHAEIPVERLRPNPRQPRKHFDPLALQELADDIKQNGLIEEIVVRQSLTEDGYFEIVCGERRTRSCRDILHWLTIPVQIRVCSDAELLRIALAENEQHQQLTAYERALAYDSLRTELGGEGETTIRLLAEQVHKNKDTVQLHLNLLKAQPELQRLVQDDPTIPLRIIDELRRIEDDASRAELLNDVRKKIYNQDDIIEIVRNFRRLQAQKAIQQQDEERGEQNGSPELKLAKRMKVLKKYDGQVKKLVEHQKEDYEGMTLEEKQLIHTHVEQWIEELRELLV